MQYYVKHTKKGKVHNMVYFMEICTTPKNGKFHCEVYYYGAYNTKNVAWYGKADTVVECFNKCYDKIVEFEEKT